MDKTKFICEKCCKTFIKKIEYKKHLCNEINNSIYNKLTRSELLVKCNENGITKYRSKNKTQLIELLNNQNTVISNIPITNTIVTNTVEYINELYEKSSTKKWIKLIPNENTISFDEYTRNNHFIPVADITLDKEIFTSGKNKGNKRRNTLVQFNPVISNELYNKKTEWLYLLTINNKIVKIGGTRTGLKGRTHSYLCGHHIEERGKSGDCSKTNGFIYNTFVFYLNQGYKIQMYGYELPKTEMTIKIFDNETKITAQTYHAYETTFLEDYKKNYNEYPILNDNCDPDYKL
jgi:hypothetical protein